MSKPPSPKECCPERDAHVLPYEKAEYERDVDFRRYEVKCQCGALMVAIPDKLIQMLGYQWKGLNDA